MTEQPALPSRVLIIGVRGFLGRNLARDLARRKVEVLGTTRSPAGSDPAPAGVSRLFRWDGKDADALAPILEKVRAVINLAGAPLKMTPWSSRYKTRLFESRVTSTAALTAAATKSAQPVRLLQGSAIGYYGNSKDAVVDEASPQGEGFLARLTADWERAAQQGKPDNVSLALLRTGVVLDPGGGAMQRLRRIRRLGVLPLPGGGTHWVAWIHMRDYLSAVAFLLARPQITGAVNLSAPTPERFRDFAFHPAHGSIRGIGIPVPAGLVRLVLGSAAEPLVEGQRARPARLLEEGFEFNSPVLE